MSEYFSKDKEMFDFISNYSNKSRYYDDSNKLVVGKMNDETADVALEQFLELKPKMYSLWYMIIVSKKGSGCK